MAYTSYFDHGQLEKAANAFVNATKELQLSEALESVEPHLERYRLGLFRLLVVGEIKKGKSSLVNALLGCPELVPTGIDVATSTVFKIHYGPERRYRVHFQPQESEGSKTQRAAPIDISAEDVTLYGTETGNPRNGKGVDFIGIEYPHPLLEAGLVIIDLPGLGGTFREHSILTMRYLPKADCVLFVIDSTEHVLARTEIETLGKLRKNTERIAFVQTKIDLVGEDQWRGWMERNLEIIEEKTGLKRQDVPYFAVSSSLKADADAHGSLEDLQESGFPEFTRFLNEDLLPQKQDALALPMVKTMNVELLSARRPLDDEFGVVSTTGKDDLEELERQYRDARDAYESWKKRELPRILDEFTDAFDRAHEHASERTAHELDPSPYGSFVGKMIASLENSESSVRELADNAAVVGDATIEICDQKMTEISTEFDRSASEAYRTAAEEIGKMVAEVCRSGKTGTAVVNVERQALQIQLRGGAFEQGRSAFYGMTAGSSMTGMGVGAAIALLHITFPPLLIASGVAVALGGIFGGWSSFKERRAQQRQTVLAQLRTQLCDLVRRMQQEATRHVNSGARQLRKEMMRALNRAIEQRDEEFRRALNEIEQQKRRTQDETRSRLGELRQKLGLIEAVVRLLQAAEPKAKAA